MSAPLDVSIVIVNWNSREYVRDCVASILAHTRGVRHEIIVVDSGSFDGCAEMLAERFPQVRFIQSPGNVGFGQANNLGVRHARAETLLLLNPDTELHSDAISSLCAALWALPRAGIVGCRLLNSDGSLQGTCVQPFPTILNQVLESRALEKRLMHHRAWKTAVAFEGRTDAASVEVIAGACMAIRRTLFDALGGFSRDYFMYAEDVDLCYRAGAAGWINYYVPGIELVHHGGGTTRSGPRRFSVVMMRESLNRFLARSRGLHYAAGYRAALTASALARLALIGLWAPVAFATGRQQAHAASLGKWLWILRWGLGLERWTVRRHATGKAVSP